MNHLILVTENGLRLIEVPEKPKYEDSLAQANEHTSIPNPDGYHSERVKSWEQAIASIIADESKHVRLKFDNSTNGLLFKYILSNTHDEVSLTLWLKEKVGQTFEVPSGMEVSFIRECIEKGHNNIYIETGRRCSCAKKLAILSPKESESKKEPLSLAVVGEPQFDEAKEEPFKVHDLDIQISPNLKKYLDYLEEIKQYLLRKS